MTTLAEELTNQMTRVRNDILPYYEAAGPAGALGAGFIKESLARAESAMAKGDVVAMVGLVQSLKETE